MDTFTYASYVIWGFVTALGILLYAFTKPTGKEKRRMKRRSS